MAAAQYAAAVQGLNPGQGLVPNPTGAPGAGAQQPGLAQYAAAFVQQRQLQAAQLVAAQQVGIDWSLTLCCT